MGQKVNGKDDKRSPNQSEIRELSKLFFRAFKASKQEIKKSFSRKSVEFASVPQNM